MGFTVKRFKDFRTDTTKWDGMIEQIVCASGRLFLGTRYSTFTAYIRLRGYMHSDKIIEGCYYHTMNDNDKQGHCHRSLYGNSTLPGSPVYPVDS